MAAITGTVRGAERATPQRKEFDGKNYATVNLTMVNTTDTWTHGTDIAVTDWAFSGFSRVEPVLVDYTKATRTFTLSAPNAGETLILRIWYV